MAATSGPRYPGTGASVDGPGYAPWTNPGYITADDTSYATSYVPHYAGQDSSEDLQGTSYGFTIPTRCHHQRDYGHDRAVQRSLLVQI